VADVDLAGGLDRARRRFHHLKERRPDRYHQLDAGRGHGPEGEG
jgi:hypothetical protein